MAHESRRAALLKKHGLKGVNKPKRTPDHKTKSHMVLAAEGHSMKLIRFGQQGVRGAGKSPTTAKDKARKKSYYAGIMLKVNQVLSLVLSIGHIKSNGRKGKLLWLINPCRMT